MPEPEEGNDFEKIRYYYKPDNVEVLFVGESRPRSGRFFYNEDSNLYREIKQAFNDYFDENIFTLNAFKRWNCWLYDICENPVNGLNAPEREAEIVRNIPRFEMLIALENPKYIVVCKKGLVMNAIRASKIMREYRENETIFFLPYPIVFRNIEFKEGLKSILRLIDLKRTYQLSQTN